MHKSHLIILITAIVATIATACSGTAADKAASSARPDSLLVDSLVADTVNLDTLSATQCGIRLAELEISALLTLQQYGETSVAATRALATVNRSAMKIVERFQTDTVAQNQFNTAYDSRYQQLAQQYPQLQQLSNTINPASSPEELGAMGAEMEIMAQLAQAQYGTESEEYKKAKADMDTYSSQIIDLFRDNPTAQELYLSAYAAHYRQLTSSLSPQ